MFLKPALDLTFKKQNNINDSRLEILEHRQATNFSSGLDNFSRKIIDSRGYPDDISRGPRGSFAIRKGAINYATVGVVTLPCTSIY